MTKGRKNWLIDYVKVPDPLLDPWVLYFDA